VPEKQFFDNVINDNEFKYLIKKEKMIKETKIDKEIKYLLYEIIDSIFMKKNLPLKENNNFSTEMNSKLVISQSPKKEHKSGNSQLTDLLKKSTIVQIAGRNLKIHTPDEDDPFRLDFKVY